MGVKSYLVYAKTDMQSIKRFLEQKEILFKIEEKCLLNKRGKFCKPQMVYIISIENDEDTEIDDIWDNQKDYSFENIQFQTIKLNQTETKKEKCEKKVITNDYIAIILMAISIISFFQSVNMQNYGLLVVALSCTIISLFLCIKKSMLVAVDIILLMAFLALGLSAQYTKNHVLELLKYRGIEHFVAQYSLFLAVIVMIICIIYIIYCGFKYYNNRNLCGKIKYCITLGVAYIAVMQVVIGGYANLISIYHNDVYFKYVDMLLDESYTVTEDSAVCVVETREQLDDRYLVVEGHYNKEYGSTEKDFLPRHIVLHEYDYNDNYLGSVFIEPETNTTLESNSIGTSFFMDYLYFSVITYFTIGYGDMYPIAETIKNWVMQEAVISHVLTALLIPICLVIGQKFIENKKAN